MSHVCPKFIVIARFQGTFSLFSPTTRTAYLRGHFTKMILAKQTDGHKPPRGLETGGFACIHFGSSVKQTRTKTPEVRTLGFCCVTVNTFHHFACWQYSIYIFILQYLHFLKADICYFKNLFLPMIFLLCV